MIWNKYRLRSIPRQFNRIGHAAFTIGLFLFVNSILNGQGGASGIGLKIEISPNNRQSEALTILDQIASKIETVKDLSEQLKVLLDEVQVIQTQMKSAKSPAAKQELEKKLENLQGQVEKSKVEITTYQSQINALNGKLDNLRAKEKQKIEVLEAGNFQTIGGMPLKALVSIPKAAPRGGVTVKLKSASSLLYVPPTVIIKAGETYTEFTIKTKAVSRGKSIRVDVEIIENQKSNHRNFEVVLRKGN